MSQIIEIIVVDDHEFFRNGVVLALKRIKDTKVIAEASNGNELLEILTSKKPDIILLDIKMPEMDGIEAANKVASLHPDIKILALSMFSDEEYLESMINAGVHGFLLKNADSKVLEHALEALKEGKQYFAEEFIPYFTQKYINPKKEEEPLLTARELEILNLVAEGLTNQEIADRLNISIRTVTNHRANLNAKTGSKNTVNLLSYALKHNLVKLD